MRAVVQRVREARVLVDGENVGAIGTGLCVLLGVAQDDEQATAERLVAKVARLRVFENEDGKLDRNVVDVGGAALVVSQFTLLADSRRQRGTRPDFSKAARPDVAERLYDRFCQGLREHCVPVETGMFGTRMVVEITNDGPVTLVLDA
jgi:D-tyrosyl-tRNA(Tyr) deacylase